MIGQVQGKQARSENRLKSRERCSLLRTEHGISLIDHFWISRSPSAMLMMAAHVPRGVFHAVPVGHARVCSVQDVTSAVATNKGADVTTSDSGMALYAHVLVVS